MNSLCDRVRSNDSLFGPVLDLDGRQLSTNVLRDSLMDLASYTPLNTCITGVRIGERVVQDLSDLELCRLLECVGCFACLEHLEVSVWERELNRRKRIPASTLAKFLQSARNLKSIIMWPFLLIERMSDLALLNESLYRHPTLQSLHLLNILALSAADANTTTGDADHVGRAPSNSICLSSLIITLATVPNLKHLQLAPGFLLRPQQGMLWQDRSSDAVDGSAMLSSLSSSALCLDFLVQHSPKLESLALRNSGLTNDQVCNLATQALRTNTTVRHLDLRFNPLVTEQEGHRALLEAIKEHNFHLRYIDLDNTTNRDFEQRKQLQFYQRLNQVGRHDFLKNPNASWNDRVQVLIACNEISVDSNNEEQELQLNLLFHLLQRNPSIICEVALATASENQLATSKK
ncbi:hypothetical protein ACA910_010571 [Epithemia clementina (nom. ined.)]